MLAKVLEIEKISDKHIVSFNVRYETNNNVFSVNRRGNLIYGKPIEAGMIMKHQEEIRELVSGNTVEWIRGK